MLFKDTHKEKAPSNETPGLTKSTNMGIWVVGTISQLLIRGSYTEKKISKTVFTGKTPFFLISLFCSHHFIRLNIGH